MLPRTDFILWLLLLRLGQTEVVSGVEISVDYDGAFSRFGSKRVNSLRRKLSKPIAQKISDAKQSTTPDFFVVDGIQRGGKTQNRILDVARRAHHDMFSFDDTDDSITRPTISGGYYLQLGKGKGKGISYQWGTGKSAKKSSKSAKSGSSVKGKGKGKGKGYSKSENIIWGKGPSTDCSEDYPYPSLKHYTGSKNGKGKGQAYFYERPTYERPTYTQGKGKGETYQWPQQGKVKGKGGYYSGKGKGGSNDSKKGKGVTSKKKKKKKKISKSSTKSKGYFPGKLCYAEMELLHFMITLIAYFCFEPLFLYRLCSKLSLRFFQR